MPEVLALACGALIAGGLCAFLAGLTGVVPRRGSKRRRSHRERRRRLGTAATGRVALAVAGGVLGTALTGWPVVTILVPAVVLLLPGLLATPVNRDLLLLEALDRWVRLLVATLSTGVSIPDAIRATRRQVPALLADPVAALVARLDDRWPIRQSLLATADDLASPDADAVLAALVLAAERGGTGAVETLQSLADSIGDRLRAGREIEAEQAKPRIVVRQVTVLTLVILGGAIILGRDFFAPYGTWYGQIILASLLAAYLGSLVWLRRLTAPRVRERILQ
ncbi:type II secretion system F family protein [Propionicicella superfundia]|uniref:type II secretion system F family protein n=1 Tax=Propionicicella superfundia TaxID=348582 RepID=UPI00040FC327|nr:type II secretion system F family protein [Propionicicella superfundia]